MASRLVETDTLSTDLLLSFVVNGKLDIIRAGKACIDESKKNPTNIENVIKNFVSKNFAKVDGSIKSLEMFNPDNQMALTIGMNILSDIQFLQMKTVNEKFKMNTGLEFTLNGNPSRVRTRFYIRHTEKPPYRKGFSITFDKLTHPSENVKPRVKLGTYIREILIMIMDPVEEIQKFSMKTNPSLFLLDFSDDTDIKQEDEEDSEQDQKYVINAPLSWEDPRPEKEDDQLKKFEVRYYLLIQEMFMEYFGISDRILRELSIPLDELQNDPLFLSFGKDDGERLQELQRLRDQSWIFKSKVFPDKFNEQLREIRREKFDPISQKFIPRERNNKKRKTATSRSASKKVKEEV